jgi:hypothetical protein
MYFLVENNKKLKKNFECQGVRVGTQGPLGAVGRILVQKCAMLYQSNIFFEKHLYGLFRKKNKMGDLFLVEAVLGAQS